MKSSKRIRIEVIQSRQAERRIAFENCQNRMQGVDQERYYDLEARIAEAAHPEQAGQEFMYSDIIFSAAERLLSSMEKQGAKESDVFLNHLKAITTLCKESEEVHHVGVNGLHRKEQDQYSPDRTHKKGAFAAYNVLEKHYAQFSRALWKIEQTPLYTMPEFEAIVDLLLNYTVDERVMSKEGLFPGYFSSISKVIYPFQEKLKSLSPRRNPESIQNVIAVVTAFERVANEVIGSLNDTKTEQYFETLYQNTFKSFYPPPSYQEAVRPDLSYKKVNPVARKKNHLLPTSSGRDSNTPTIIQGYGSPRDIVSLSYDTLYPSTKVESVQTSSPMMQCGLNGKSRI